MRLSPPQVEQDLRLFAARKLNGAVSQEKPWVYPPEGPGGPPRPIEVAFGELGEPEVYLGCDHRPIDPAHPLAARAGELQNGCSPQAGTGACACVAD